MKIRNGFVSNSSSSSFIVSNSKNFETAKEVLKQAHEDCFIYHGVLYTSFISDMKDEYLDICKNSIFDRLHEGNHGTPYDETEYIKVNGSLNIKEVYIPKDKILKEDLLRLTDISIDKAVDLYTSIKTLLENYASNEEIVCKCKEIIGVVIDED